MEYINRKTGATFSSPCFIYGGDWVLVTDDIKSEVTAIANANSAEAPKIQNNKVDDVVAEHDEVKQPATDNAAFDAITVKQIKQELDAFGIQYDPRAKKQELFVLMMKGK